MKEIKLNGKYGNGKTALVDDEDFCLLNKYEWYLRKDGYAVRRFTENKKCQTVFMHREIMGAKTGDVVDHINHTETDNQKSNLRLTIHGNNCKNTSSRVNSTSIYLGISFRKDSGNWRAEIKSSGKRVRIGSFNTELDAAYAYNLFANKLHKEFANLNNIDGLVDVGHVMSKINFNVRHILD